MMNARVMVGSLWFVALCCIQACGGGSESKNEDGDGTPSSATEQTGAAGDRCEPASCPTLQLFGSDAPGCCQGNGECGGTVMYMGRSYCAPAEIEEVAAQIVAPIQQLETEEIVTADECPGMAFQGATIPGCCDQTGVCGVSTASFAAGESNGSLPFDIPVTCISAEEARSIGMTPAAAESNASAPIACTGAN